MPPEESIPKKPRLKGKPLHRISAGYVRSCWRLTDGAILLTSIKLPDNPTLEILKVAKVHNEEQLIAQAENL